MVNLKPANQSSQKTPIVRRRGFSLQQLLWFIFVSVLVHGLGLFLFARYQSSQIISKPEIESKAIDFVTVPDESETKPPPETKNRAENNSAAQQNLEAESTVDEQLSNPSPTVPEVASTPPISTAPKSQPTPTPIPQPKPPEPKPETVPTPTPQPKPPEPKSESTPKPELPKPITTPLPPLPPLPEISKPPVNDSPPVLSDSETTSATIPEPAPPETKSPVATSLPPDNEPVPQTESPPVTDVPPETSENSASSLLGGDYKKTLANGGAEAFFSPEAISLNAVLDPSQINALKDFDHNSYLAGVRDKLRPNWNPDRTKIQSTLLKVELDKSGQIMKLEIARSSGSQTFDLENLETFRKSAPFDALPPEFPLESFKFQFEFSIID